LNPIPEPPNPEQLPYRDVLMHYGGTMEHEHVGDTPARVQLQQLRKELNEEWSKLRLNGEQDA
jgi:hypothetical protein